MSIKRSDSQQTTCIATLVSEEGERRQAASATCSIRPGKGLTFSIDVMEDSGLSDDDKKAMADMFGEYLMAELKKARGLDLPI